MFDVNKWESTASNSTGSHSTLDLFLNHSLIKSQQFTPQNHISMPSVDAISGFCGFFSNIITHKMKTDFFSMALALVLLTDFLLIDGFDVNDWFRLTHNQEIVSDRNRFIKFDLIPNVNEVNIVTRRPWRNVDPSRRRNNQKWKRQRQQTGSQYVWDDYGKFWTYRNRNDEDADLNSNNNELQNIRSTACQPPFCIPRRCPEVSCNQPNCITPQRICHRHSVECDGDQKQVSFGNEVVCVRKASTEMCSPSCSDNGICIKGKCYCENGYQGETCSVMDAELCKRKRQLYCAHGCSFDKRLNNLNCVCGEKESKNNCIELRTCANGCKNGGVCLMGKCQCADGFDGDECQNEIGSCSPGQMGNRTCQHICISEGRDRFQCKCRVGYNLNDDGKSCNRPQCFVVGTLEILGDSCKCKRGWKGEFCSEDIDECSESKVCHQICTNTPGSYQCSCINGFQLQPNGICERTCTNGCNGKGDCLNGLCYCFKGWHGSDCSLDIDECKYSHGCEQQCVNTQGSFHCSCSEGSSLQPNGKSCLLDICQPECLNGGVCKNNSCICPSGFTGIQCESLSICKVLLHCQHDCSIVGSSVKCICKPGYTLMPDGKSCTICNCSHGRCMAGVCVCDEGFTGPNCGDDIDECAAGTHRCGQSCMNVVGSYVCSCNSSHMLSNDRRSCEKIPCYNCKGKCINNMCICLDGFTGQNCDQDMDECALGTHRCDQNCINIPGSYLCSCNSNYILSSDGRSCERIPCLDCRGKCVNNMCICLDGFTGQNCDQDIDECLLGTHRCEQNCLNSIGSYSCYCNNSHSLSQNGRSCEIIPCFGCKGDCINNKCLCPDGFKGLNCDQDIDECENKKLCQHDCTNTNGSFLCSCQTGFQLDSDKRSCILFANHTCQPGFKGSRCEEDVDECSTGEHQCEQLCINTIGGYECGCIVNFNLTKDGRSCSSNLCDKCKRGKCEKDGFCKCERGFKGKFCDEDIDECKLWKRSCDHDCENTYGSYKCSCKSGYVLSANNHTCVSICSLCKHGKCEDNNNTKCKCKTGWTGLLCDEDINECSLPDHKCEHYCINTNGSYSCSCHPPFYLSTIDGRSCIRKHANCSKPCQNGGKCINKKCRCHPGFQGESCEEDINECLLPFEKHRCIVECRNTFGSYECTCPIGYVALDDQKTCKISPRDTMCKPHCLNGGVCRDMTRCQCQPGFEGVDCGTDIDECTRYKPCDKVHGICKNTYGSHYCQCKNNYVLMFDGANCMTMSEAILKPHLRYRGRGTKGVTQIITN